MKSLKLDILLEHLNLNCKYYVKDGGETFCERAWANTERGVLKIVNCEGQLLKCKLTRESFLRRVG